MLSVSVFPSPIAAPSNALLVKPHWSSIMERLGDEFHLNETEATAGAKGHGVRYVLGFSLLLIVIAMSAAWILGSVLG